MVRVEGDSEWVPVWLRIPAGIICGVADPCPEKRHIFLDGLIKTKFDRHGEHDQILGFPILGVPCWVPLRCV